MLQVGPELNANECKVSQLGSNLDAREIKRRDTLSVPKLQTLQFCC